MCSSIKIRDMRENQVFFSWGWRGLDSRIQEIRDIKDFKGGSGKSRKSGNFEKSWIFRGGFPGFGKSEIPGFLGVEERVPGSGKSEKSGICEERVPGSEKSGKCEKSAISRGEGSRIRKTQEIGDY